MQLTRKQIIDYLNSKHIASAVELSQTLNVTAANIRHHLSELKGQGIIEEVGNLPVKGRGRPTKLYCLSKGSLDHNLDFLADTLLQILTQNMPPQECFEQIAMYMIGDLEIHPNLIQRLNQTIQWLNERNYQSRWEASPAGPRIILGFCPYIAILDTNPEMCLIDTQLISQLSGTDMQQISKLERGPQRSHQCVFIRKVQPV